MHRLTYMYVCVVQHIPHEPLGSHEFVFIKRLVYEYHIMTVYSFFGGLFFLLSVVEVVLLLFMFWPSSLLPASAFVASLSNAVY